MTIDSQDNLQGFLVMEVVLPALIQKMGTFFKPLKYQLLKPLLAPWRTSTQSILYHHRYQKRLPRKACWKKYLSSMDCQSQALFPIPILLYKDPCVYFLEYTIDSITEDSLF